MPRIDNINAVAFELAHMPSDTFSLSSVRILPLRIFAQFLEIVLRDHFGYVVPFQDRGFPFPSISAMEAQQLGPYTSRFKEPEPEIVSVNSHLFRPCLSEH